MLITQIADITTDVTTAVGDGSIVSKCYLGRINADNTEYVDMVQEGRKLALELASFNAVLGLYQYPGWVEGEIQAPVEFNGSPKRLPTTKEVEKRTKELRARLEKGASDSRDAQSKLLDNICNRIAYLTKSWDLTDDAGEMAPVTTENLRRYLPESIINAMFDNIETAVFGPLAPGRNFSTS